MLDKYLIGIFKNFDVKMFEFFRTEREHGRRKNVEKLRFSKSLG